MAERANVRQGSGISLKTQILEWWAALPEPTTRAVADLVGCRTEYVRVVIRQRKGGGVSAYDKAYISNFKQEYGCAPCVHRYRTDPEARRRQLANNQRYRAKKFGSEAAAVAHYRAKRSKERV